MFIEISTFVVTTNFEQQTNSESVGDHWFEQPMKPIAGNQLTSIRKLSLTWSVSLEYQPEDDPHTEWANIFHNTIGENRDAPGTRIPSVFQKPNDHQLRVMSYVNGDDSYPVDVLPKPIPYEWYSLVVEQKRVNSKYVFSITVNGNEVYSIENTTPEIFYNVNAWVSDPWYTAAPGLVQKLHIMTGQCKFTFPHNLA